MRYREFRFKLHEEERDETTPDPAADAELDDRERERFQNQQNAVVSRGDYSGSNDIREMQRNLQSLGYSLGPPGVDGKFGPYTAAALAAFKQDYGLSGDGDNASDSDLETMAAVQSGEIPRVSTPTTPSAPSGGRFGSNAPPGGGGGGGGAATGGQPGSLEGTNVMAANPDPAAVPNQNIVDALNRAASELGVQVQITPQGGRAARSSGTQNHPPGEAADFQIVQNGQLITPPQNSQLYDRLIATLVRNARARGVRPGIGGYGWGIHYDESTWRQGNSGGVAGTWNNGYDVSRGVNAGAGGGEA